MTFVLFGQIICTICRVENAENWFALTHFQFVMLLLLLQCTLFTDLMDALKRAYSPVPHVELLESMFDIKEWMKPVAISLHNNTIPHCFVIQKDVVLRYKNWSRDKQWLPSPDPMEWIKILKVTATLVNTKTYMFSLQWIRNILIPDSFCCFAENMNPE